MATTCPTQLPSGRHEASGRSTKVPAIPLPDDERLSNYGVPGLPEDSESKRLLQRKLTATARPALGHSRLINPDGNVRFDQQRTRAEL